MRYMSSPPYRILAHQHASFQTVQRMVRFARYWDLIGNSGRFPATLPILLSTSPFECFMQLSDWLFNNTGQTHRIALPRLFTLLHEYLNQTSSLDSNLFQQALVADFSHNRLKGKPKFLHTCTRQSDQSVTIAGKRQQRHLTG